MLIKVLHLSSSTERCTIHFLGCAAALNGIHVARNYAQSHPGKASLVCCLELSSPHITFNQNMNMNDSIIHALFADGCAALVIRSLEESDIKPNMISIVEGHSMLVENSEDGIVLAINQQSVTCTLSKHLSTYIEKSIFQFVQDFCAKSKVSMKDVQFWTVHPGGARIINAVEKVCILF